jgi:hypothetical protein
MSKYNTMSLVTMMTMVVVMALAMIGGCCGGGGSSIGDLDTSSSGGGGGGKFAKSCNDITSLSQCSEHTDKGMNLLGEDFYKSICELTDGKWTTEACPTDNRVGSCDDGDGSVTYYYTTGEDSYDEAEAKQACKDILGTYKAG